MKYMFFVLHPIGCSVFRPCKNGQLLAMIVCNGSTLWMFSAEHWHLHVRHGQFLRCQVLGKGSGQVVGAGGGPPWFHLSALLGRDPLVDSPEGCGWNTPSGPVGWRTIWTTFDLDTASQVARRVRGVSEEWSFQGWKTLGVWVDHGLRLRPMADVWGRTQDGNANATSCFYEGQPNWNRQGLWIHFNFKCTVSEFTVLKGEGFGSCNFFPLGRCEKRCMFEWFWSNTNRDVNLEKQHVFAVLIVVEGCFRLWNVFLWYPLTNAGTVKMLSSWWVCLAKLGSEWDDIWQLIYDKII